jgi:hypothetical protein
MAKIWGQPKDAKKAFADVEVGGAATPEKPRGPAIRTVTTWAR